MKFSLIVSTINRKEPLDIFLNSLFNQSYKNFEVIIIDQNKKGYLDNILEKWMSNLNIIHRNVPFKGLSKARNYGVKISNYNILAFPDDDCFYETDTLKKVIDHFNNKIDTEVLICQSKEYSRNIATDRVISNKIKKVNSILDLFTAKASSNQIFIKSNILSRLEKKVFDPILGVGSGTLYGSSEETDLLLRLYKKKSNILINNDILVFHPSTYPNPRKSYLYGIGRNKILKKNKLPFIYYIINIIYPFINMIKRRDFKRYKSYLATSIGRSGLTIFSNIYLKGKI